MTDLGTKIVPVFIRPSAIVLVDARANRDIGVEFDAPGRASITFTIVSTEYTSDEYFVVTRYEVALSSDEKDPVANLSTTFLMTFTSDVDTEEMTNISVLASLQLAAVEGLYTYHRDLLIQMSERFDIPAYRLDVAFDRGTYLENVMDPEFEKLG